MQKCSQGILIRTNIQMEEMWSLSYSIEFGSDELKLTSSRCSRHGLIVGSPETLELGLGKKEEHIILYVSCNFHRADRVFKRRPQQTIAQYFEVWHNSKH